LQITAQHFRYPLMQMQLECDMERMARQTHAMGDWRAAGAAVTGEVQITAEPLPPSVQPSRCSWRINPSPMRWRIAMCAFQNLGTSALRRFQAQSAGIFDIVLFNEDGQITEGTRGNIAVQLDGRWVTPPLQCGLLPGVGRALALSQGRLTEQVVTLEQARMPAAGPSSIACAAGWMLV
jgi:para-aminobenzoate synthetase/4-amino-4-deoxychorismate lyase